MSQQIVEIPLERIIVANRLRPVDDDYVQLLAASMAETGQHTPIEVAPADIDGDHRLIAGAHRVAAAKAAGLPTLRAIVFLGSQDEEALREVDENLMRRELSELDRAVFMAKRAEIYQRLYPETKQGGDRRSDQKDKNVLLISGQASFRAETSKKLGLSERHVNRVLKRADIEPALRALLAPTRWADHGATLDGLVKAQPDVRRSMVYALTREVNPAPSFAAARHEALGVKENVKSDAEAALDRLIAAWGKAGRQRGVQKQFLRWVLGQEAMRAEADAILSEYEQEGDEGRVLKAISAGRPA
ncbi:MAG: ParB N-terminal domain-containing protein [Roseococcus sp.]|nr:ParB N-terminal domain-containing protein [Roseococcus sp.]